MSTTDPVTADQSRPVPRASAVGSIDREALVAILDETGVLAWAQNAADRILALVRPGEGDSVPALTLNRQAAWRVISDAIERDRTRQPVMGSAVLDDLEDCVAIDPRLREGVTLTPEEAQVAHGACRVALDAEDLWAAAHEPLRALAARLEALS